MKGSPATPHPATRPLRGLTLTLAACLLAVSTGFAASAPIPVTAVQINDTASVVQLVTSGTLNPTISHLANPQRTVVDLAPARLAIKGSGTISLPVEGGQIMTRVRLGQFRSDIVRVVIEHPSSFGRVVPGITQDQEHLTISFTTGADILASQPASLPPIPQALTTALPTQTQPVADTVVLDALPVSINAGADGGSILFKYPEVGSYTVWLERFPNRLVFETPARPAGVAATAIRYDLTEIAQLEQPLVEGVRIYKAAAGGYTKVVCYLNSYVSFTDRLTPEGIEVAVASTKAPKAEATSNDVPFSGKDWVAPGADTPAWDPAAIQGAQNKAEMDLAADAEPPMDIRITELETKSEPVPKAAPAPTPSTGGPATYTPPAQPEVVPMSEKSAPALYLFKGESVIVPVNRLARTSVGDPEVLAINVLSQSELLLTAKGSGRTSLITWEEGIGRTVRTIDVSVSMEGRRQELAQVLNDQGVKVSFVGDKTVVLEGSVTNESLKNRAALIAQGAAENVVNLIEIDSAIQVLIKVRMVELNNRDKDELFRQMGSGAKTESGDFSFGVLSDILDPEFPGGGLFDISLKPGIVNNPNVGDMTYDPLDFFLKALETSRRAKILSQPNIVTMAGHEAKFRVGGEIPYTFQNENRFNIVDFREFGIELNATPQVDSTGMITVTLNPTVRTVDFGLAVSGIPGFRTRTVTTNVQLRDAETLVIGGLIQREIAESTAKVPILGDLPLIGNLFRSKSRQDDETELLIFLTLQQVKNPAEVQAQIYSEEDVRAGGVADDRYTFYGPNQRAGLSD